MGINKSRDPKKNSVGIGVLGQVRHLIRIWEFSDALLNPSLLVLYVFTEIFVSPLFPIPHRITNTHVIGFCSGYMNYLKSAFVSKLSGQHPDTNIKSSTATMISILAPFSHPSTDARS